MTITYTATVNYNDITGVGTPEETKNVATVKSDENPDPKTVEKTVRIEFDGLTKIAGPADPVSGSTNLYSITWTINVNKDKLMTVGGVKFEDNVLQPDRTYFTGTGITVAVTHENGTTENRTFTWNQLTVRRRADGKITGWDYTPPSSDGKASYVITATTITDVTGVIGSVNINNGIRVGKRYTTPNRPISVGIGEELKPKKVALSYNSLEAYWKITIPIPAQGYNMLVRLVDDIPYTIFNGVTYNDTLIDVDIQGLQPGESYTLVNRTGGQYQGPDIHFYQDEAKTTRGFQPSATGQIREVTVYIRTGINQEWLNKAHDAGYAVSNNVINPRHINNASLRLADSTLPMYDLVIPKKQTIKKTYKGFNRVDINGVQYPVFSYEIEFTNPLDGQVISDAFDTDYLKLYQAGNLQIMGRNAEGDVFDTNGTVTPQETATGVDFTLTNLPKNAGQLYSTYRLTYDLIVKDAQTLQRLNTEAFQNENNQGKVLKNVAKWNGLTSDEVSVIYNYNPKLDKHLIHDPTAANSYVATFELILNEEKSDVFPEANTYTVKDELSPELRLLPELIRVTKGNYTLDYGFDSKTNTITFNNVPDGEEVRVTYDARVLGTGNVSFSNTVSMGQYRKVISSSTHIASSGSGTASNPSITIVKRDKNDFAKVLPGATFKLSYRDGNNIVDVKDKNGQPVTFTTGPDGTALIEGNQSTLGWVLWADGRTYLLTETVSPTGYTPLTEPVTFSLVDIPTNNTQYPIYGERIYVSNERPKTRVEARKVWENIGPGLTVPTTWFKLYRQIAGGPVEEVPGVPIKSLAPGTTTVAWEDLYAQDLNENPYTFSVKEVDASGNEATPQDYLKKENGLTVTNTFDGRMELEVTKIWSDSGNQDGFRPAAITVRLFADGREIESVQVTAATGWKHTFTNLPRFKDGREIVYTVQEDRVPGYEIPMINGFTITNKRIPEVTSIRVSKTWDDAYNQDGIRPDKITLILYADNVEKERKEIQTDAAGDWKGEFTNLDVYKNGNRITYRVDEVLPQGYTKEITGDAATGFTIKNSHTPEKTKVSFEKVWDDAYNQDGIRPDKITVILKADGTEVDRKEVQVDQDGNWKGEFTNLDVYKAGVKIAYTVDEVLPQGYTKEIAGDAATGFTIKNSHTPEKTKVSFEKVWDDAHNQDGIRPDKLTVILKADGTEVDRKEVQVDQDGNWKGEFTNLDVYKAGVKIAYTVDEVLPQGYTKEITGDAATGFTIKNSHTPEKTKVSFKKVWDDVNNHDEVRPLKILVHLLADGVKVDSQLVEVDADGNWKGEFTNLDVYKAGVKIVYTVDEDVPIYYEKTISGDAATGFTITNKHVPGDIKVTLRKVDPDGKMISGAKIQIFKGAMATGTPVEEWTTVEGQEHLFTLPVGVYTFREVSAPKGYTKVTDITFQVNYDGSVTVLDTNSNAVEYKDGKLVITDQYDVSTIDILVTKKWVDQENKDSKRPAKITVRLMADGKEVASQDVTAQTDWKHTFTNLPKYKDGKEIVYTITEDKVDGYQSAVSGTVSEGFVVENTYIPPKVPPKPKTTLPRTGDGNTLAAVWVGMVFLLIGLVGFGWKKEPNV
ncbi:Cna B-type domain-containing protein [Streptococcus oriscaviae]|uniref:Cna B-type domain-containing protein n=1 Tax=Streptococcus oriscaviae TaxID=2781599 RepID=A0ABX7YJ47_9STRE|nr:Cna B-type domain-containing protein [Streptococcus oriscaviae]QUE53667.1 Cna B-type domain-containing protein [Streptococcus oriscaviae]